MNRWSAVTFVWLVRLYQVVFRPLLGCRCRFHPSCSDYAIESFQRHGCIAGICLSLSRIGRCHPWNHGGYDPVP